MAKNVGNYDRFLLSESPTTPGDEGPPPHDDNNRNIWKNWADGVQTASASASEFEDRNQNDKADGHPDNDNTLLSSAPATPTIAKFTEADVHRFLLQLPSTVLDKVKYHLLTSVWFKDIEPSSSAYPISRRGQGQGQGQGQGHGDLPPDASDFVVNDSGPGSGSGDGPAAESSAAGLGGSSSGNSNSNSNFRAIPTKLLSASRPASVTGGALQVPPQQRYPATAITGGDWIKTEASRSSPLSRALSARFFGLPPSPPPWNHHADGTCCSPSEPTPPENTDTAGPATGATPTITTTTTMAAEEPLLLRRGRRKDRIPSLGIRPLSLDSNKYLVPPGGPLRTSGSGPGAGNATPNNRGPPFESPPPLPALLPVNQGPSPYPTSADVNLDEELDRGPQKPQELEADVPTSIAAAAAAQCEKLLPQKPFLAQGFPPSTAASPSSRLSLFNVDTSVTRGEGGHGHPGGTPPSLGFGFGGGSLWDRSGRADMPGKDDNNSDATSSCCTVIHGDEGPIGRVLESDDESGQQSISDVEHLPALGPARAPVPQSRAASITAHCGSDSSGILKGRSVSSDNSTIRPSRYSRFRSHSRSRSRSRNGHNINMDRRAAAGTQTQAQIQDQGLVGFDMYRSLIGGAPNPVNTEEDRGRDGVVVVGDVSQDRYASFVGGSDGVEGPPTEKAFLSLPPPQSAIDAIHVSLPPSNVDTQRNANEDDGDNDGDGRSHDGAVDEKGEPINANAAAASASSRQVETQHVIGQWAGKVHGLAERTRKLWNDFLDVQHDLVNLSLEMSRAKVGLES